MSGLQLTFRAASSLPLDECLVGVVTIEAGDVAARVSARLNLIEGDLAIVVTGMAGYTARCAWPWPVDSMPRWVDLAPGSRLAGAVPLLATDTSAPLFPGSGDYTLTVTFDVARGLALSSAPVPVRRTIPNDEMRAAALQDRDVLQSLLSGSVLGDAASGLEALEAGRTATTRTLSALARDRLDEVIASADLGAAPSVAEIVEAGAAVLPGGFADADPRRAAIEQLLGGETEQQALFHGTPF